jgi:hypothetical protein
MPLVLPFGAALNTKRVPTIAQYSNLSDNFFIVGEARIPYFEK